MKRGHVIVDRLKGMSERFQAPQDAAELIVNMRYDPSGAWREVGGFASVLLSEAQANLFPTTSGAVRSLHWFARHNGGEQYLVWEFDNPTTSTYDLCYLDGPNLTWSVIEASRSSITSPSQGTQFATNAGWLYYINGHDEPARWNGRERVRVGFDRRPPPPRVAFDSAAAWDYMGAQASVYDGGGASNFNDERSRGVGTNPAAGAVTYWMYGYAVTYVNDLGQESPPSETTWVSGRNESTKGRRYVRVEVPDAPKHVRGIRLWRTENVWSQTPNTERQVSLYLEREWRGGVGRTFADGTPDRELGRLMDRDASGLWPGGAKYIAFFKGCCFVCGMPEYPDLVAYSAPLRVEQYPEQNRIPVGDAGSGEFRGMHATKNALVLFKTGGIYLIFGDPVSGFQCATLTEDMGGEAPNAVVEVPGRGLLFLNPSGVYLLEGALANEGTPTSWRKVSQDIQWTWENRINRQGLIVSQAVYHHGNHEVWIQVPQLGTIRPTIGLVWHVDIDEWSIRENWPIQSMAVARDHRGYMFFGSWDSTSAPGVQVYLPGRQDRTDGQTILSEYRSSWLSPDSVHDRTRWLGLQPYIQAYGSGRVLYHNYRVDQRDSFELSGNGTDITQLDAENSLREVWGTGVWGASKVWTAYPPVPVRKDIARVETLVEGREFQWTLRSDRVTLIGMDSQRAAKDTGAPQTDQTLNPTVR